MTHPRYEAPGDLGHAVGGRGVGSDNVLTRLWGKFSDFLSLLASRDVCFRRRGRLSPTYVHSAMLSESETQPSKEDNKTKVEEIDSGMDRWMWNVKP